MSTTSHMDRLTTLIGECRPRIIGIVTRPSRHDNAYVGDYRSLSLWGWHVLVVCEIVGLSSHVAQLVALQASVVALGVVCPGRYILWRHVAPTKQVEINMHTFRQVKNQYVLKIPKYLPCEFKNRLRVIHLRVQIQQKNLFSDYHDSQTHLVIWWWKYNFFHHKCVV